MLYYLSGDVVERLRGLGLGVGYRPSHSPMSSIYPKPLNDEEIQSSIGWLNSDEGRVYISDDQSEAIGKINKILSIGQSDRTL